MITDELKDLIASKIAGQGSAVDAGSALPEILGGLVDLLKNQQEAIDNSISPVLFPNTGTLEIPVEKANELMSAVAIQGFDGSIYPAADSAIPAAAAAGFLTAFIEQFRIVAINRCFGLIVYDLDGSFNSGNFYFLGMDEDGRFYGYTYEL